MDNELWEVLSSFKGAIDMLMQRVDEIDKMYEDYRDQTDDRMHKLETTLYDEIINPTNEYIEETNRNARFEDFSGKYGERLGEYNDALKALEGEDFDLTKSAFDQYDSYEGEDKPEADAYVDALIEEVGNQLETIKRGLGLPEDAEIEVKQTEDGETVVEVEDEGEGSEEEVIASTEDEPEVEAEEETEVVEDEEDDPDEIAAFEEELRNQK